MGRKFTSAEVELTAKDNTKGAMNSVGDRVGGLTKLIKGYWAEIAAAYMAIKKVVAVMQDWVKESRQQEVAVTKLNTVLKSMGNYTYNTSKEMQDFASSMENVTTFSDDVIISGQAVMATFREIGKDVFPEAMEAAMDMSTIFGQDLQSSVVQLGKALNDPITGLTALRRIGVSFSETQKKQIEHFVETNQLAKAQKIILEELRSEFGNASRMMGQTAAGQADILKHKMANLKKELGFMIDSEMPAFLDLANSIAETLLKWVSAINANKKALKEWRDLVADMNKAELADAIKKQDAIVQSLANQIKPLQDIIEKNKWLTREYQQASKAYDKLLPQYDDGIKKLYELQEALKNYDKAHRAKIKTDEDAAVVVEDLWEKTANGATYIGIMSDYMDSLGKATDYTAKAQEDLNGQATNYSGIMDDVISTMGKATEVQIDYGKKIEEQAQRILPLWSGIWETMGDTSMSLAEKMRDVFKGLFADLLEMIGKELLIRALKALIPLPGLFHPGAAALAFAGSAAAYAAAGFVRSLAKGGDFTTSGPEMIMVGDNPSGRERVSVTPAESTAYGGSESFPLHCTVNINGERLFDIITRATRSKEIKIYKGAITVN